MMPSATPAVSVPAGAVGTQVGLTEVAKEVTGSLVVCMVTGVVT